MRAGSERTFSIHAFSCFSQNEKYDQFPLRYIVYFDYMHFAKIESEEFGQLRRVLIYLHPFWREGGAIQGYKRGYSLGKSANYTTNAIGGRQASAA